MQIEPEFVKGLQSPKNCIPVKRGGRYHVRQYRRDVPGVAPRYLVEWRCAHCNLQADLQIAFGVHFVDKKPDTPPVGHAN